MRVLSKHKVHRESQADGTSDGHFENLLSTLAFDMERSVEYMVPTHEMLGFADLNFRLCNIRSLRFDSLRDGEVSKTVTRTCVTVIGVRSDRRRRDFKNPGRAPREMDAW